ncbi:MAG: zinc ABC transporter substrate-binding protein [Deltaproteobacteria bacterium]|nr:zinc ABC transporter substrate-binding protein [Deltaproteobacteria bacterium]MBW2612414.1 zinc ABC transporter substrate-binding protein [Deltaproteobacteria bacterium]MBW2633123.1 zinc ABC transporter substrate-binding protein [Deltaproteobacteria bacterium]
MGDAYNNWHLFVQNTSCLFFIRRWTLDVRCSTFIFQINPVILFILVSALFFRADAFAETNGKIPVSVSIAPQAFFIEKVGGDRISVHVLLPPGRSPATYAPTPLQVSNLMRSVLFFRIGVPFETALIPGIEQSAKQLKIVDTRKGITLRRMSREPHLQKDDGPAETQTHAAHGHGGDDPHIWLDPSLVMIQAATMRDALVDVDPDGAEFYRDNYRVFAEELGLLDERIRKVLAPVQGARLLVFHPSFGYFADAYGLKQIAVEKEGKAPKGKELAHLIKMARQENVRIIFVQPQFDRHAAEKIAAVIDGAVIPLDPLARDYIRNLEAMAYAAADALK